LLFTVFETVVSLIESVFLNVGLGFLNVARRRVMLCHNVVYTTPHWSHLKKWLVNGQLERNSLPLADRLGLTYSIFIKAIDENLGDSGFRCEYPCLIKKTVLHCHVPQNY